MRRLSSLVVLSTVLLVRPSFGASSYTFTTLDVPGAIETTALGINDRGQVVGNFNVVDSNANHGYLLSNGQFTTIDVTGATDTFVNGINNLGQMVGFYTMDRMVYHGFVLDHGQFTTFDAPGAVLTFPYGINDKGQVVGQYQQDSNGRAYGFLRTHGQFVVLEPDPTHFHQARGINNDDRVVGIYEPVGGGPTRGFRADADGTVVSLETGVGTTFAYGINGLGEIVGNKLIEVPVANPVPGGPTMTFKTVNFVLAFGTYTTFDPGALPDSALALGINNRHQIVGNYDERVFVNGVLLEHGFIATPAGEPVDESGQPSADGSRVPGTSAVFDLGLSAWTLGPGEEILRDGIQAAGGYGSQILWFQGSIYVLGDDGFWWRWTGDTWTFAGANDPSR